MNEAELKARKAAVDFVNAHFTDFESLDRVYDVYHDVHKAHEASRQQLEEQVNGDGLLSTVKAIFSEGFTETLCTGVYFQ